MEMITTKDFYYLPRIKNLEKKYKECKEHLKKFQQELNNSLDMETFINPFELIEILDKMQVVEDLMKGIQWEVIRLKSETFN